MTIENLQAQVGTWHIATFGECSNKRIARKLLEEAAEFMVEQSSTTHQCMQADPTEEAADVLIVLMAWAHRNRVNLVELVAAKLEIIKTRDMKERSK